MNTARPLLDIMATYNLKMALPPGIPTLQANVTGNLTRPDNVVELCSALGWDLDFLRLSSYVSHARPVGTGPYYRFPESQELDSHGRPAGLTLFRF